VDVLKMNRKEVDGYGYTYNQSDESGGVGRRIGSLWDACYRQTRESRYPQWHGDVLEDREQCAQDQREEEFVTWKETKRMINDE